MSEIIYQKALRDISRIMVQVKRPVRLLKIITRFLYRTMHVKNAAMAVRDTVNNRYVFYDSRGDKCVPASLVKLDHDHALVQWFTRRERHVPLKKDFLTLDRINAELSHPNLQERDERLFVRLQRMREAMVNLGAYACFPGYYKHELLGMLFVGVRHSGGNYFSDEELLMLQTMASDASMSIKTAEYQMALEHKITDLEKSVKVIQDMRSKDKAKYLQTIMTLANTVDAKDPYTCGHSEEVERWGMLTVAHMPIYFDDERKGLLRCALRLHDFGKLGVPDHILNKTSSLTQKEWIKMKDHAKIGARILGEHEDFREVSKIILHHHENYDGSGYPYGLKGEEIPLEARIIAVVDSFHAMISDRPYRKGLTYDHATNELKKNVGRQFDGVVVDAFLRVLEDSIQVDS